MTSTVTSMNVGTVYISMWYCTITNALYMRCKGKTHKMNVHMSKFDRSQGQAILERMITFNMDAFVELHLPKYLYREVEGMNLRFRVPQLDEKTEVTKYAVLLTEIDFEGDVTFKIYEYTSVPGVTYDANDFMFLIDAMNNIFNKQTHVTLCIDKDEATTTALTFYEKFNLGDYDAPAADIYYGEI